MGDFIVFRRMPTPILIQVFFWLGTIAIVLSGLGLLGSNRAFYGIVLILAGPILFRIYCEILMVVFRMNETLTDIHESQNRQIQHLQTMTTDIRNTAISSGVYQQPVGASYGQPALQDPSRVRPTPR